MSAPRDPDVILAAWLDDGPADLPSSTRRAISTAVRTTPQSRAGLGLPAWRPTDVQVPRPRRRRRGGRGRRRRVCDPHAPAHRQPSAGPRTPNVSPRPSPRPPRRRPRPRRLSRRPRSPARPHRVLEGHWRRRGHRRQARRWHRHRRGRHDAGRRRPTRLVARQHADRLGRTKTASGIANADGTGGRRVTDQGAADGNPEWSPDDTLILFDSRRDGDFELVYPGRRWRRPEAADQQRRR